MTLTLSCPSAIGTGLRERTYTLFTEGAEIICERTPEPTRPVAPVRTRDDILAIEDGGKLYCECV